MNTFYEQREEKLFIGRMTRYPYPSHMHDMAELVIPIRGTAVISIGGIRYSLAPGDVAMVFPLVSHSFDSLSGDADGVTAIFPPEIIPEYTGTFHGLQPESPVVPAAETNQEIRIAVSRLSRLNMENDLPLCVAYLHVLLAGLLHRITFRPVYSFSEQEMGNRIIYYVSEHACENITLESTAQALGISVSHLSHFFSDKMHTNFRSFINTIRINKARLMMRDPGKTLTWICDACGFTNMRTFRRAFQKELGCLPSEHQQAMRSRMRVEEEFPEEKT